MDIDADFLVTDLAPTDMLLQRLGRLWRHERARPPGASPEFLIHLPAALAALDLQQATASELKAALGPSGWVYAPYVLLRSLTEWRNRSQIILPNEIRPLLEATYADHSEEPPGWSELRQQLESKKKKLHDEALSATQVWSQPALADREDVQTRYVFQPVVHLLLATRVDAVRLGRARVTLLNGETCEPDDHIWGFATAKALHWNLVRVPRYTVASALATAPQWLRLHVAGESVLGVVRDGHIFWPGHDEPSGLAWHPDEGVILPSKVQPSPRRNLEDDYESYE